MQYTKTRPCDNCPFRKEGGVKLRNSRRAEEVANAEEFPCHKSCVSDDEGDLVKGESSVACAGHLLYREKIGEPTQMMRIAERMGLYDCSKLDLSLQCRIIDKPEDMIG